MPMMTEIEIEPVKMLVMAHTGFGKTGALASLAEAGYHLHILDLDNGTAILRKVLDKKFWDKVEIESITDQFRVMGDKAIPVTAMAWTKAMQTLDKWTSKYNDGTHVIVIDSLTFLSEAAMRHIQSMNKRLGMRPYQSDWGDAQRLIEDMLALIYAKSVKSNIVVNTHISYLGGPDPNADPDKAKDNMETVQPLKGFPTSVGKALSPKIGRYFNNCVVGKVIGEGKNARRMFHTTPVDLVDAKTSDPFHLNSQYPIQTGLADLFKTLRGA